MNSNLADLSVSWRPVVGREGQYEVSSDGHVRTIKGRVLIPFKTAQGYLIVAFNTPKQNCKVHRLVVAAFIRPPLPGEEVNHLNFDKANNRIENLEWCSNLHNRLHYYQAMGYKPRRKPRFGPNGRKLSDEKVRALREFLATGARHREAAQAFAISMTTVHCVKTGKAYAHV